MGRAIRRLLIIGMGAIALALSSGCDKTPQPPLAFGASPWPGYDTVYLAGDLGYFQGANLRLDKYSSAAAAESDFRSGKIQLIALPLDQALMLRQDVPQLKIILLFSTGPGKRMDVLVTRDESIGQYHPELRLFLQGWRKALDYVHHEPDKAIVAMARHEGVTAEQYRVLSQGVERYSFEHNQGEMIGEPPPVSVSIDAMQRDLLTRGKLGIGVDTSMLVDSTLLAESGK